MYTSICLSLSLSLPPTLSLCRQARREEERKARLRGYASLPPLFLMRISRAFERYASELQSISQLAFALSAGHTQGYPGLLGLLRLPFFIRPLHMSQEGLWGMSSMDTKMNNHSLQQPQQL